MPSIDDLEGTGRLRPNLKPLGVALLANLVFGGALLGWPYLRGQARTEEATRAFAVFSACLFDAEVAARPGITLPRGERARFATLLVRGDPDWPARCRDELARVGPAPVVLLFPSVKGAESQVREEVLRLDRELAAVARARDTARVPAAPLDTVARLQGALVEQIRAAGLEVETTREAIALGERDDLPTPSIVPTQVGPDRWSIALEGGALLATSVDPRTVGQVRIEAGRVDVRRARRPRLASAVLGGREPPWVVWTTPEAQCEADPEGCAQRVTGIAEFTEDRQQLAPTAWLRAHAHGDVEDAVHVGEGAVWIAARDDGGLALRRFGLAASDAADDDAAADDAAGDDAAGDDAASDDAAGEDAAGEDAASDDEAGDDTASDHAAQRPAELDRALDATGVEAVRWIAGAPPTLAWAGAAAGTLAAAEDAAPLILESPGGRAWLASAGRTDDGWVVVASERGVRARRADGGATHAVDVAPRPPGRGAVRVLCATGEGCASAYVFVLRDRALSRATCDASGCADALPVADEVATFDPILFREHVLVAWSGGVDLPVRVTRVDASGALETRVPAACWDTEDGLCGEPRVAASADRVVLVTRAGADLRVLESPDGERWRALSGLAQP